MKRLSRSYRTAVAHAQRLFPASESYPITLAPALAAALAAHERGRSDNGDIVVTDEGFVVMAVLPSRAVVYGDVAAVPGCDDRGACGWLVLGVGARPFHSQARTVADAIADANQHLELAHRLERSFGGKARMHAAVARARWSAWSTFEDAYASGLCHWGIESFLRRYGLLRIARAAGGLPKCVLWWGGGYSRRVIAATLMRERHVAHTAPTLDRDLDVTPRRAVRS